MNIFKGSIEDVTQFCFYEKILRREHCHSASKFEFPGYGHERVIGVENQKTKIIFVYISYI